MMMKSHARQRTLLQRYFVVAILLVPMYSVAQVTLHYNERPPYLVSKDGQLTGLTGTPAVAAFKAAGVAFTLKSSASARQLALIKENLAADCGVGWFKNEEREGFGKFTVPIYQDKPQIAITAAKDTKVKEGASLESILGDKSITLLVKNGYSYGKTLDAMIAKLQPKTTAVTVENVQMLQMIQAERADFMFVAPEQADGLIAAASVNPVEFRKVHFSNAPNGENRYLLCSKSVSDEIIAKLNKAIK